MNIDNIQDNDHNNKNEALCDANENGADPKIKHTHKDNCNDGIEPSPPTSDDGKNMYDSDDKHNKRSYSGNTNLEFSECISDDKNIKASLSKHCVDSENMKSKELNGRAVNEAVSMEYLAKHNVEKQRHILGDRLNKKDKDKEQMFAKVKGRKHSPRHQSARDKHNRPRRSISPLSRSRHCSRSEKRGHSSSRRHGSDKMTRNRSRSGNTNTPKEIRKRFRDRSPTSHYKASHSQYSYKRKNRSDVSDILSHERKKSSSGKNISNLTSNSDSSEEEISPTKTNSSVNINNRSKKDRKE